MSGAHARGAAFALLVAALSAGTTHAVSPQQDLVKWRAIAAGEAEARKSGKPVLYFFTAAWCGPCRLLEQQVFSRKDVADQVSRDFVPVVVRDQARETGQNTPEMLALADRYGLRGFPTLVVGHPGPGRHLTMEGWNGPQPAVEFLKTARQRLDGAGKKKA